MKQFALFCVALVFITSSKAQNVGIGTTTPDASSKLEISSNNAGLLIPRMTAVQRVAINNPANGLLVYDVDSAAFAYCIGGSWLFLSGTITKSNDWSTKGNYGTGVNNFIGTTDQAPLRFKVDNLVAGFVGEITSNTGFGYRTIEITTAGGNSAFGYNSLNVNTTGSENTANGYRALAYNTTGSYNTAIGSTALYLNTTGKYNTATGYKALWHNSSGEHNAAFGDNSLYSNTTGVYNTAFGVNSLYSNSNGNSSTALGAYTLASNTTGEGNTATGYQALNGNTSGYHNTANGYLALVSNLTGIRNTAIGSYSLYQNTSSSNTAIGYYALSYNTSGASNTAVGYFAGVASGFGTIYNTTSLGNGATCVASNQVTIGNSSNNSYRVYANWSNISDGRYKKNVKENVPGIAFINKLRPVTYNLDAIKLENSLHQNDKEFNNQFRNASYNKSLIEKEKITYTGFVAQEVETAAQSLGFDFSGVDAPKNADSPFGLRYADFVVPLVKAVQEQQQIIEKQQQQIDVLTKEIQLLKEKIN